MTRLMAISQSTATLIKTRFCGLPIALTAAGVWRDDSQVVTCRVSKMYADNLRAPGADITVAAR